MSQVTGANEAFEWSTQSINTCRFPQETQHYVHCHIPLFQSTFFWPSKGFTGPRLSPTHPALYSLHTREIMNGSHGQMRAEKEAERDLNNFRVRISPRGNAERSSSFKSPKFSN